MAETDDINITIKGSYIKAVKIILLILIPLMLLGLNAYQYFYPNCSACNTQDNLAAEPEPIAAEQEENNTPEPAPSPAPENTEAEEPETNESDEPEEEETADLLPITGDVDLTIDKISYENKGTWAKITKIKYTIKNQKEDFTPKILIYGYDSTYSSQMKGYVEEEIVLKELKAGESVTKVSPTSITFSDFDIEKTIKMEVVRDGGTTVLDNAKKTFTIS